MRLELVNETEGTLLYPKKRTYKMLIENQKPKLFTIMLNNVTQKIKLTESEYKLLTFEKAAGKWSINFVLPSAFLLYHEAIIVQEELREIIQIIDYFDEHPEIFQ